MTGQIPCGSFVMLRMLVSNNPLINYLILPKWDLRHTEASVLHVLEMARDAVHSGWKLLHHPLYGNFRPQRQPYRTIILENPAKRDAPVACTMPCTPDLASLHYIEEALNRYRRVPAEAFSAIPAPLLRACSQLDFELMRFPLREAGWAGEIAGAMDDFREPCTSAIIRRCM